MNSDWWQSQHWRCDANRRQGEHWRCDATDRRCDSTNRWCFSDRRSCSDWRQSDWWSCSDWRQSSDRRGDEFGLHHHGGAQGWSVVHELPRSELHNGNSMQYLHQQGCVVARLVLGQWLLGHSVKGDRYRQDGSRSLVWLAVTRQRHRNAVRRDACTEPIPAQPSERNELWCLVTQASAWVRVGCSRRRSTTDTLQLRLRRVILRRE